MSQHTAAGAQPRRSSDWIGSALAGGALIAAGVALGLDRLDVIDVSVGELVWPVVLVAVGGAVTAVGQRLRDAAATWRARSASSDAGVELAERATAVFGEAHLSVSPHGRGEVGSVPVGAVAVLGSVELRVPAGWAVRNRATSLLGDVKVPAGLAGADGSPVVELHGLALLGSIEVTADAG